MPVLAGLSGKGIRRYAEIEQGDTNLQWIDKYDATDNEHTGYSYAAHDSVAVLAGSFLACEGTKQSKNKQYPSTDICKSGRFDAFWMGNG